MRDRRRRSTATACSKVRGDPEPPGVARATRARKGRAIPSCAPPPRPARRAPPRRARRGVGRRARRPRPTASRAVRSEHGNDAVGRVPRHRARLRPQRLADRRRFARAATTRSSATRRSPIDNAAILRGGRAGRRATCSLDGVGTRRTRAGRARGRHATRWCRTATARRSRTRSPASASSAARGGELWVRRPDAHRDRRARRPPPRARPGTDHLVLAWLVRELLRRRCRRRRARERTPTRRRRGSARCSRRARSTASHAVADVAPERRSSRCSTRCGGRGRLAIVRRHRRGDAPPGPRGRVAALGAARDHRLARPSRGHARQPRLPGRRSRVAGSARAARGIVRPGPAQPTRPARAGPASTRPRPWSTRSRRATSGRCVVVGGNPLAAFPDPERTRAAFRSLDVLAVVDVLDDELDRARHPRAAGHRAARAGRPPDDRGRCRCRPARQYTDAVVAPVAERRPAWWMLGQLGRRLDLDVLDGARSRRADRRSRAARPASPRRPRRRRGPSSPRDRTASNGPAPEYGWVHDEVLPDGRWRLAPRALVERLRDELVTLDEPRPTMVRGHGAPPAPHR